MKYQLSIDKKIWGRFKRVCFDEGKTLAEKLRELVNFAIDPTMVAEPEPTDEIDNLLK